MRWRECLLILGLGLLLVSACNWMNQGDRKLRVENGKGEAIVFVQGFDSLLVSLHGVHPRTQYEFVVTLGGTKKPVLGRARLTSDRHGIIRRTPLLIDIDPVLIPPDSYDVRVDGPDLHEVVTVDVIPPGDPYVYTCDEGGNLKNSYILGETVYVTGGNFLPETEVHVGFHPDRTSYNDGDILDISFDPNLWDFQRPEIVFTDADGTLPITELRRVHAYGFNAGDGFDVVADVETFRAFNRALDAADGHRIIGGTYQELDVGADVDTELACDESDEYKDTFCTEEDVYAWVNPPLQYRLPVTLVDKYVVAHRYEWKDGDPLVDVSGNPETDGVQTGCANEYRVMIFPGPLPLGDYDVIIDVDQDGRYTQGHDIIDGGCSETPGKIGFSVQ